LKIDETCHSERIFTPKSWIYVVGHFQLYSENLCSGVKFTPDSENREGVFYAIKFGKNAKFTPDSENREGIFYAIKYSNYSENREGFPGVLHNHKTCHE